MEQICGLEGIQFVTTATGERVGVLIDLTRYRSLWEEFQAILWTRPRARSFEELVSVPRHPQFGSARGLITMADDFDAPLADFVEYMP